MTVNGSISPTGWTGSRSRPSTVQLFPAECSWEFHATWPGCSEQWCRCKCTLAGSNPHQGIPDHPIRSSETRTMACPAMECPWHEPGWRSGALQCSVLVLFSLTNRQTRPCGNCSAADCSKYSCWSNPFQNVTKGNQHGADQDGTNKFTDV